LCFLLQKKYDFDPNFLSSIGGPYWTKTDYV
jgi:hypothetical protein